MPTLNDHIPHLLAELATALRAGSHETIAQALIDDNPPAHGLQRVKDAFDIEEVLGLAIVKTFVEAYHGVVTVESELGVGTTFRFTLPGRRS